MTAYFIGLDIGTSSVKAVAFDGAGSVLGKKSIAYPTLCPRPGYQEQVPHSVFKSAITCLKHLVVAMAGSPACISLSSAMHSLIAVDKKGNALTNSILWSDSRSADIADKLKGTPAGMEIYRHTGTPIHPMSPLCKIAWLRRHQPSVFQKTFKFIGIKEYLIHQLTGHWLTDYSIASATGLFDAAAFEWFQPSLDFAGIDLYQLPQPVPPDFNLGAFRQAFSYLGISPETPFIIGASDGCLANLGAGASEPGEAVLTIGTSGALRMNNARPVMDPKERIFNYLLEKDSYVSGGASNNGGVVYEWFTRQFFGTGPAAKSMVSRQAAVQGLPAGSEGLLFIPYMLGERAPVWNARATGGFFGLKKLHTKAHLHKAVLEGIVLNMAIVGEVLEQVAAPMEVIYANGGFTKMPVWVQMAADVFGKKITVTESGDASAFGAALLGLRSLGIIPDFSLIKEMAGASQTYQPDMAKHDVYLEKRQALKEIYGKIYG
ncbi:MAG: gluconokinase [Lewinellaceae bacterium]|nr:gluconokinase [Lewinellaceae bacterium]